MAIQPDDCLKLTTVVVVDPNKSPELRDALVRLGWTPPPEYYVAMTSGYGDEDTSAIAGTDGHKGDPR